MRITSQKPTLLFLLAIIAISSTHAILKRNFFLIFYNLTTFM